MNLARDEKVLLRICILLSLGGIVLIYIASVNFQPRKVSVSEIDMGMIGDHITVKGKAQNPYVSDETLFFDLKSSDSQIKVVKFNYKNESFPEKEVVITGKVDYYEKDLEIIAEKIKHT